MAPEGTTYQISCRRHGNLIAWAYTPGDAHRQQADLINLYKLLEPHQGLASWWRGGSQCKLEFTAKVIPNV